MRRVYWGVGIMLTILLCVGQLYVSHAAERKPTKRQAITICWYQRRADEKIFRKARSMRMTVEVDEDGYYYMHVSPSAGYQIIEWKGGEAVYKDKLAGYINVRANSRVDIYEERQILKQTIRYMVRNPESGSTYTDRTEEYIAEYGELFEKKLVKPPTSMVVESVRGVPGGYGGTGKICYTVTGSNTIRVTWSRKCYCLRFHGEGGEGYMAPQTLYSDVPGNIFLNRFVRSGYRFVGWKGSVNGKTEEYMDGQKLKLIVREDKTEIDLYAQWKPLFEKMILEFYDSEEDSLLERSREYSVNETVFLPGERNKENAFFLGWSLLKKGEEKDLLNEKEYVSQELFEKGEEVGSLKKEKEKVRLPIYGIWDYAPKIVTTKVLIPESWAKEGKVTPDFLKHFVRVEDKEDGELEFDREETEPHVSLVGFDEEKFLQAKGSDEVKVYIEAVDRQGNCVKEELKCKIVGPRGKNLGKKGKIRFINEAYKDTLSEKSVWRCRKTYWETLLKVLAK